MTGNNWSISYVRGYYYGRTGREDIAEEDLAFRDSPGFKHGLEVGRNDFQNIDLPLQALSQEPADPL